MVWFMEFDGAYRQQANSEETSSWQSKIQTGSHSGTDWHFIPFKPFWSWESLGLCMKSQSDCCVLYLTAELVSFRAASLVTLLKSWSSQRTESRAEDETVTTVPCTEELSLLHMWRGTSSSSSVHSSNTSPLQTSRVLKVGWLDDSNCETTNKWQNNILVVLSVLASWWKQY